MMMSAGLGVALAVAVRAVRIPTTGHAALAAVGMAFGLAVWLVMQYGVWRVVDATAAPLFTPWVFAVAHLMFGAVAGAGLAAPSRSRTPVHA